MFIQKVLKNEAALLAFAAKQSPLLPPGFRIYLSGTLGAGKTTFCRGLLRGWGYEGAVKSPTYTLVQTYTIKNRVLHHFDLYRLQDPEELEFIGFQDYLDPQAILCVEWPEKGGVLLPPPDWRVELKVLEVGRELKVEAVSERGGAVLRQGWLA